MTKRDPQVLTNNHLPTPSAQERMSDFLTEHGRSLGVALGCAVALLLAIYVWSQWSHGRDERDYLDAAAAFEQLETLSPSEKSPAENASYVQLKEILERHPELAPRYNGRLAQTFLRLGDMQLAVFYADKALKQLVNESLPFYEDYSKTSLLIAGQSFPEAYKRASFLGKRMADASTAETSIDARGFGDTLLIFNQIRLAALQQKMGNSAEELAVWKALRENPQAAAVLSQMKTGKLSYLDYVNTRQTKN